MVSRICSHEPAIVEALAAGDQPDAALQAHLASCASCREAAAVARALLTLASTSGEPHALPDPEVVWWKAQLLRRWEAQRAVAAPVERMHRVEVGVGLASLAVFLVWQWSGLVRLFSILSPESLASMSAAAQSGSWTPNAVVLVSAAAALGIGVLAALHRAILAR